MEKEFNVTGLCFPDQHYMADVSKKLDNVIKMVDKGLYFIINRPRQYGKTTTLYGICDRLVKTGDYIVFNMSFEGIGDEMFENEAVFAKGFVELMATHATVSAPEYAGWLLEQAAQMNGLKSLSNLITQFLDTVGKKVVVLIDEVDQSSNNQLFISFLAILRNKYLQRKAFKTFHSVVLAGVHDVKSLKLKLRPNEEQKRNSPWNIAAEFTVDMNLQPSEIRPMLDEYCLDKGVKMDVFNVADILFYYTSGYPFLVSKICKIMDESILPQKAIQEWTDEDLSKAIQQLVKEDNTNFESLTKNIQNNKELYDLVYQVVIDSEQIPYNKFNPSVNFGVLYGIFVKQNNRIAIHNRIYQEVLLDYMTTEMYIDQLNKGADFGAGFKNRDKSINMEAVLIKFQAFMREQYSRKDRTFLERNGRLVFLAYLKPIINGSGYDFKEPQISDERRLDIIITYLQHRYLAELKIWRGKEAHKEGLAQLTDYLDRLALTEGYLVIFDHASVKEWKNEWVEEDGKRIFVVWV